MYKYWNTVLDVWIPQTLKPPKYTCAPGLMNRVENRKIFKEMIITSKRTREKPSPISNCSSIIYSHLNCTIYQRTSKFRYGLLIRLPWKYSKKISTHLLSIFLFALNHIFLSMNVRVSLLAKQRRNTLLIRTHSTRRGWISLVFRHRSGFALCYEKTLFLSRNRNAKGSIDHSAWIGIYTRWVLTLIVCLE